MESLPVLNAQNKIVGTAYIDKQNNQLIIEVKTDQAKGEVKVALVDTQFQYSSIV